MYNTGAWQEPMRKIVFGKVRRQLEAVQVGLQQLAGFWYVLGN
jgi:hypothetical protein